MRVHPLSLKPNIGGIHSNFSEQQQHIPNSSMKKLRRLPHVFNYFLELPFRSDADVAVEEKEGFFCFMAKIELEGAGDGQVRAQAVEIHPGVTKIVVRKGNGDGDEDEQLNVDTWRYRLPASTMPELATAVFVDGELIVTVPKDDHGRGEFDNGSRGARQNSLRQEMLLLQLTKTAPYKRSLSDPFLSLYADYTKVPNS
ncbi:hypothetical protein MTR67_027591 [Solanum verrucosum]|uniref:Uncharacterized protein n=1 Tax=Solanum verrucosum TaxID=315347 RepID=A0AAF0TVI9_SOLVR|nr:hypothetical protein MTR67_027591 [Solanum verrucosum]